MDRLTVFDKWRPLLFSIAYRMLGTVMEAEDILQEAFMRWQRVADDEIDSPKSYLSAVVTRLCIDHLRSAKIRREEYIGPWLPEPVVTDPSANPAQALLLSESLSMALLVVLESLSPVERAVFILREVFDFDYPTIARIVGKNEANCRQLVSRAKRHVAERRPRFDVTLEQQSQVVEAFIQTVATGDLEGLMTMLDADVEWISDGGGLPGVAKKPVRGVENVARFVLNIARLAPEGVVNRLVEINGGPGIISYLDGNPVSVISIDIVGQRIKTIHAIANPDKLQTLPPPE